MQVIRACYSYCYVICVLLLSIGDLCGQTDIRGNIVDESNHPLVGATVVLLEQKDSTMVSFGITNDQGSFLLEAIAKNEYLIQVSYVSFQNLSQAISIDWSQTSVKLERMTMMESTELLQEVTIKAKHIPLGIHGDTIVYNTSAYLTRPGATVEDLLKKMPGIKVQRDGSIKAQGENVEKILVDGKSFFGKDPKIATQNLEAEAIKKIQVYDKQSELAEFTGVDDDNEEKTINLQLKDGYKNGGFGNIEAQAGTQNTYQAKLNYNRFNTRMQASTILSSNTINEQAFSFNEYIAMMGGLQAALSGSQSGLSFSELQGNKAIEGKLKNTNGGLNFNYDFNKKLKWTSNYFYLSQGKDLLKQASTIQFVESDKFSTIDSLNSLRDRSDHRINTKLIYQHNPLVELVFKNSYYSTGAKLSTSNQTNYFNPLLSNQIQSTLAHENQEYALQNEIQVRKKFATKGRNWINKLNHKQSTSSEIKQIAQDFMFLNNDTSLSQSQDYQYDSRQFIIQSVYTEPLQKGRYMALSYAFDTHTETPEKLFFDDMDDEFILNRRLSTAFYKQLQYHNIGLSFKKMRKKTKLNAALHYQKTNLTTTALTDATEQELTQQYNHLLPSLSYKKELSSSSNIKLKYDTKIDAPSLNQLMPIPDNSNPNLLMVGNPSLSPSYTHTVQLQYNLFDQFNFRNLFSSINFNYIKDRVVNQVSLDKNFLRTITPINSEKTISSTLFLSYSEPIKSLGLKYRINAQSQLFSYSSFLNQNESQVTETSTAFSVVLENRTKDHIDLAGGVTLDYSTRRYSLNEDFNQAFSNYTLFLELDWYMTKSLSFSSSFDAVKYSQESFSDQSQYLLWNSKITYSIKENQYSFHIAAFDILGQNRGISRTGGINSLTDSSYNTLQRYVLAGFRYRLGKTKKQGISFDNKR